MSVTHVAAEALLDAPADVVYHCLADYREHHRVGGFLPPTFTRLDVLEGGLGAGTTIRFTSTAGGRARTATQRVSEPEPGRLLMEEGDGIRTTFRVQPSGSGCRVRIGSDFEAGGLQGLLMRLFAARMLRPIYADELARLERYAQKHGPVPDEASAGSLSAPSSPA